MVFFSVPLGFRQNAPNWINTIDILSATRLSITIVTLTSYQLKESYNENNNRGIQIFFEKSMVRMNTSYGLPIVLS